MYYKCRTRQCRMEVKILVQIDIGIDKEKSMTDKGRILEHLVAKLLKVQQYDVVETIRVTGMEIDVFAKNKINNMSVLVECKAWDSPLPADVISKLLGNVFLRNADCGWLVTTGPLSKDALGTKIEWEERTDSERKRLSFYTYERIIEQLVSARIIVNESVVRQEVRSENVAEDVVLMLTESRYYWIIPVLNNQYNTVDRVYVFDAYSGEKINNIDEVAMIKRYSNYYADANWVSESNMFKNDSGRIEEEVNSIVPVIGGDDWEDYRPARPEDFVGRKLLIQNMFKYFDAVIENKTSTRLFSITAPSGMGKSSLVLKLVSMSLSRRKSRKYFVFALDSRTAISARYVELSIKACFEQADKEGFTDKEVRNLEVSSINQMFQSDSILTTLEYLKRQNKVIVLIFDQFEELFSKKELFPVFEKVKQLSNIIDQLQGNIIIGFSWKTDLTLPADHPAYYMWSNLSDRRKEFDVPQFKSAEIKGAIRVFGSQLGEEINPVLRNYLVKQCQGYPWLLKKLCIHVFKLISDGKDQATVIGQKLNIVDLFERDINELTAEEHKCVVEIAKDSPADYFKIVDLFGSNIVQALINKRIVIRRASRLTLYWDIFKDYVIDNKVPNILLDYIPQQQYATIAQITKCLIDAGNISTDELAKMVNMKNSTIENYIVDSVMFGIAKREDGLVSLVTRSEKEIVLVFRKFFYRHLVYIELKNTYIQTFNYAEYYTCFCRVYEESALAEKTKRTYAAKLLNWFISLGMIECRSNSTFAVENVPQDAALLIKASHRRSRETYSNGHATFWGETSPKILGQAYEEIVNNQLTYEELKNRGYRNAVGILWAFGGLRKTNNVYYVQDTLETILQCIEKADTITLAKRLLEENPSISEREMGEILEREFNKHWKEASKIRYGSAVRRWARYFMSIKQ